MLSRRNVRIKVMQMLYSMNRDTKLDSNTILTRYRRIIHKSYELYLFSLYAFMEVAVYSKKDAAKKMSKLLPSEEDKQFTAKLGENELVQSLFQNDALKRLFRSSKMEEQLDKDIIRRIYGAFSETDDYKAYIRQAVSEPEDHRHILLALFKYCAGSESYEDLMEDNYPLWQDDKSLVVGAIKKTIKALPANAETFEDYQPNVETTVDFGETLLVNVCNKDEKLLELIEPTLKNWDVDRVAVIDMILLKMALCELTEFSSIPTKVTLNEFVEISKMYSTEKSKDFINGILDRLLKKLNKDGKINKKGRGLIE